MPASLFGIRVPALLTLSQAERVVPYFTRRFSKIRRARVVSSSSSTSALLVTQRAPEPAKKRIFFLFQISFNTITMPTVGEKQCEVVLVGCGAPNRGMGW